MSSQLTELERAFYEAFSCFNEDQPDAPLRPQNATFNDYKVYKGDNLRL